MFVQLVSSPNCESTRLLQRTVYYNPGPHGQDGEPGTRSGQYDSSGVFDMHISPLRAW